MEGWTAVTYYEEFGVAMTASAEQIREAYKHLARLLHPDKLTDPEQRRVAECQMRRLNAIYETLSHAEKRRVYDLTLQPDGSLAGEEPAEDLKGWPWVVGKLRGPDGAWVGAGVIVVLLMVYAVVDGSVHAHKPASSTPAIEPVAPRKEVPPRASDRRKPEAWESQIHQLRHKVEEVTAERDAANRRVALLEARLRETPKRTEPSIITAQPPPAAVAVEPRAGRSMNRSSVSEEPEARGLSGTWYFAKTRSNAPTDLYPPEYIEAVIQEVNGVLMGRYRARFVVSDRAISPEVVFQFQGKQGADSSRIPWSGPGGAKGEVKLKLLTANSMEVAWVAHDLGKSLGLAYGTAVLIRAAGPE
ncbi:MAG: J domain-containing protein [Bryobacterales bacterium]|nr:J domain-containing protein [Bryobacterales bacterium]